MRETIEFRIAERDARLHLEPGLGVSLGGSIRKVVLPMGDARVQRIAQLNHAYGKRGDAFFMSWNLRRSYTERELRSAELLNWVVRAHFEPTGSMCGTVYDASSECPHCGAGARQVSELLLDTRRIPKGKDIAQTLSGEMVVSSRFASAFLEQGLRGAEFHPVLHHGRGALQASDWRQLVVTSKPLVLSPRTVAGNNPFDLDEAGAFRCPLGHVAGLNQISELYVEKADRDDADLWVTDTLFGDRRGELRPEPRLLISPRLRDVLWAMDAKGYALEAAHFV
ncbi:hypothetical protein [Comamonas sp. JC664]|uniref:hypothetical protein n=1 Tax=Comamonas sp. JC664 TaxID=2801917 RepID=UPI00174E7F37|nr:hypothetical protein [Comamonas sp. JC664]MBL0695163.1 hypothetical protein [Comamonas sp. JC664]GHG86500.1 hypothetical protein GCM10012319_43550 [Comamonas sp. KCTC 72670]